MQIKTTVSYRLTPTRTPTSEKLAKPNDGKDVEQLELSYTPGGNAKRYNHFENWFGISYKVRNILTIYSYNPTQRYLPKWSENLCLHKNLSTNVSSGFMHSSQKLGTTWRMDKLWYIHITDLPNPGIKPRSLMSPTLVGGFFTTSSPWETHIMEYYLAIKGDKLYIHKDMDESQMHMLGERNQTQKTTCWMTAYIWQSCNGDTK